MICTRRSVALAVHRGVATAARRQPSPERENAVPGFGPCFSALGVILPIEGLRELGEGRLAPVDRHEP